MSAGSCQSCRTGGPSGGIGEDFCPEERRATYLRVALLGHSYVCHLAKVRCEESYYAETPQGYRRFFTRCFGVSGGRVGDIASSSQYQDLITWQPKYTVLLVGGNDINVDTRPAQLAKDIGALVDKIESDTTSVCFVLPIERRRVVRDTRLPPDGFDKIRNGVNRYMRYHPPTQTRFVNITFQYRDLSGDGVHLDVKATEQLLAKLVAYIRKQLEQESWGRKWANPTPLSL